MAKTISIVAGPVSLREAMADRKLLGIDLSERQDHLVELLQTHETVVGAAGRQAGKSLIGAGLLVHNQLLRPDLDAMARGGSRACLCVANSREQAGITLGYCRRLVERSPLLRSRLVAARDDRLIFEGGGLILAMPCQDRLMRGLSASAIVLDEFAHFLTESDGPRVAERVYAAVRPSLAVYGRESRLLVISTPFGDNLFARLYQRAASGELPGAAAFTATSAEMNPRIDPAFLEGERLLLGEPDFRREFEASFEGGGGQFFAHEEIHDVVSNRREALPEDGRGWVCAIDPSSGGGDPFAVAVVGHDARAGFAGRLLVGHVERWQPRRSKRRLSRRTRAERDLWVDTVLDKVAAIAKRYSATVVSDQHMPGVVIDELRQRGVTRVKVVPWSPTNRTEAFQALRARVATERIELVDDAQLIAELRRVRTRLRSGSSTIEMPRVGDSHGDLAMALAAAVLTLDAHRPAVPARWSSPLLARRGAPMSSLPPERPGVRRGRSGLTRGPDGRWTSESIDPFGAPSYSRADIEQLHRRIRGRR